jgi:hypothetical protein
MTSWSGRSRIPDASIEWLPDWQQCGVVRGEEDALVSDVLSKVWGTHTSSALTMSSLLTISLATTTERCFLE